MAWPASLLNVVVPHFFFPLAILGLELTFAMLLAFNPLAHNNIAIGILSRTVFANCEAIVEFAHEVILAIVVTLLFPDVLARPIHLVVFPLALVGVSICELHEALASPHVVRP